MPKTKQVSNKKSTESFFTLESMIYLLSTIFFVFLIYSFSLPRPWLPFDERSFYKEVLFPIPTRFDELKEIINAFGLNYHIESMNTFFSSHLTIRSNPIAAILVIITSWLFQKNAFLYHLLQLSVHLTNTFLVWVILKETGRILGFNFKEYISNKINLGYLIVSLLSCMWALHSANTEAVLLTTNWTAILTYTFCFIFIYYELWKINKYGIEKTSKPSGFNFIFIAASFCTVMFLTEYGYSLPFVVFFIHLFFTSKHYENIKKGTSHSFRVSLPYFAGLSLFAFFSMFRTDSPFVNIFKSQSSGNITESIASFIERNLWLTPQIFIKLLSLILFPITLTPYQSDLTNISPSIFNLYSVFSFGVYVIFLSLPIILIIKLKTKFKYLSLLLYAFFFSLLPFLHILLPTYCLSADRYCYFPSFVFFFLLGAWIFNIIIPKTQLSRIIISSLVIVSLLFSARTFIRILDWSNPYILYKSAINAEKSPLYKAHKLIVFGSYLGELGKQKEFEDCLKDSLNLLSKAFTDFKYLVKKYPNQPVTLYKYGLDYKSLLLKTSYLISTVRFDNYKEPPGKILEFYSPFIKKYLKLASPNEISFYAEVLVANNEREKAERILKYGLKKYPYSSALLFSLSEYYLQKQDLDKAHNILTLAYKYFPNDPLTLKKYYKYYLLKNDPVNQARFAYLIGLREHDAQSYQAAFQLYLNLRQLQNSKLALKKLIRLTGETPLTILLTTSYLDSTGQKQQILPLLTKAYLLSKSQGKNENVQITKSILASLINTNIFNGKTNDAKMYLSEFKQLGNLTNEDKNLIQQLQVKLANENI